MLGPRCFQVAEIAVAAFILAPDASGSPQSNLGLTVGGGVENVVGGPAGHGVFHLGARADTLFLRRRGDQMALGPYLDVATSSFDNLDTGGGAEWLLPIRDDLPIVLSAGAFWRNGGGRVWAPGVEGEVFFGSRSYNFHSWYGLAGGLFVQTRWLLPSPATLDVILGVQLDAVLLALPALLLYEAVAKK